MTLHKHEKQKFNHKEAFCHMKYRAVDGACVTVWNSRDGVTPFLIRIEGKEYQHVDWGSDRCEPNHKPKKGDWIFTNLTMERAIESAKEYVGKFWDHAEVPMRKHPSFVHMTKAQAVEHFATNWIGDGKQPMLEQVK